VKVQGSIVQPSDFWFRSHRLVPPFPFAPDNLMRDHRKPVLYDVTESAPFDGAMILMRVGVAEHYASGTGPARAGSRPRPGSRSSCRAARG